MGYHVIHKRRTRRSRLRLRVDTSGPGRHPVRMSEQDRKRLGDAVRVRRGQLRMTQKDFAQRANLTSKQIIRIEKGQVEPRVTTLDGLDTASEWPPGTAQSILDEALSPPAPEREPESKPPERDAYDDLITRLDQLKADLEALRNQERRGA